MNESFESILSALTGAAQAAANKAKSLGSIAKSNVNILTEQEKLKRAYADLGKLYYRDFITGEEPDDAEYMPLCDDITALIKSIQSLRESIDSAKTGAPKDVVLDEEDLDKAIAEELEDLNDDLKDLDEELADLEEERRELEEARAEIEAEIRELTEKAEDAPKEGPVEIQIEVVDDPEKPEE